MNIFSVTFVLFLILKLVGIINWSWWIVCSPLIIQIVINILILLILLIVFIIGLIYKVKE